MKAVRYKGGNVPVAQTVAWRPFAPKRFSRSRPRDREQIGPQVKSSSRFTRRLAPRLAHHKDVVLTPLQRAQVLAQPGVQSGPANRAPKDIRQTIRRLDERALVRGPSRDFDLVIGSHTPIDPQNLGAKRLPLPFAANVFIAQQTGQSAFLDDLLEQRARHLMPQNGGRRQHGMRVYQKRAFVEQPDAHARLSPDERLENRAQHFPARIVPLDLAAQSKPSANRTKCRLQFLPVSQRHNRWPVRKRLLKRWRRRSIQSGVKRV